MSFSIYISLSVYIYLVFEFIYTRNVVEICPHTCLYIYRIDLSICLYVYPSTCRSIHRPIYLSIDLGVSLIGPRNAFGSDLSTDRPTYLSRGVTSLPAQCFWKYHLYICRSINRYIYLSIHLYICLSIHLPVHIYIWLYDCPYNLCM